MKFSKKILPLIIILIATTFSNAQELIIGEERIEPGIVVIFEGAIKDIIMPSSNNLNENLTDIHIEARVNWDVDNVPKGTPKGGFVPYLHINALVTNQKTGLKTFIDLIPHINLSDNFHYARNISLPGEIKDLYSVKYTISPPSKYDVSLHMDWKKEIGNSFFETVTYNYKDVKFEEIAKASRR
ncbi:iron transporter [Flavobacteriales bacterium]|nr:iron transporter [Flavobacteriales bacterium]